MWDEMQRRRSSEAATEAAAIVAAAEVCTPSTEPVVGVTPCHFAGRGDPECLGLYRFYYKSRSGGRYVCERCFQRQKHQQREQVKHNAKWGSASWESDDGGMASSDAAPAQWSCWTEDQMIIWLRDRDSDSWTVGRQWDSRHWDSPQWEEGRWFTEGSPQWEEGCPC